MGVNAYTPTKEEMSAAIWCINNKIIITPRCTSHKCIRVKLEVEMDGRLSVDPKEYTPLQGWSKKYEYCIYYYEKYNKNVKKNG